MYIGHSTHKTVQAFHIGRLYNKESALEFLIDKSKFECASSFEHLRGLKDLKQLKLTENRNFSNSKTEKGDRYIDTQDAKYICPVVGLEMNGVHKFSYIWSCGCVLSERALKELKGSACHKCGELFTQNDIIPLNGTEEEVDALHARMTEKRLQQKLEKKAKKSKKQKCETATSSSSAEADNGPSTSKKAKLDTSDSKLTNGHSALANGSKGSKFTSDAKEKMPNGSIARNLNDETDLFKKGSIQKDPKASSAYKSLFTTSDRAKNQMKGHWVTSNPYWM